MNLSFEPRAEIALRSLRGAELSQARKALSKLASTSRRDLAQHSDFIRRAVELPNGDYYVVRAGLRLRLLITLDDELLRQQGAQVVIGDLPGVGGEAHAQAIGAGFEALDVTREEDWRRVVDAVVARHGALHVLVNAAGIVGDSVNGALESTSLTEWRRVMAVNLDGTFLGCREAMTAMRKTGRGAIVNLSSVGAYYPTAQSVAYGASKGAVMQLTKSVALAGAENGARIRCNSVHPGMIETPLLKRIVAEIAQRSSGDASAAAGASIRRMPLGAPGQPEQVAQLIAFLASDEADYITGSEFTVDGGWRMLR